MRNTAHIFVLSLLLLVKTSIAQPLENPEWDKVNGLYAVITTNKGIVVCELEYKRAPMTTGNFVSLCEGKNPKTQANKDKPFYDGMKFHRVIPGFMAQGGDPQGNGAGDARYTFPDELVPEMKHIKGTLAMANAGPNTNSTQFYITTAPTPHLDGHYSVFGYVVFGQTVVDALRQDDTITTIRILRVGNEARRFDAVKAFLMGAEKK